MSNRFVKRFRVSVHRGIEIDSEEVIKRLSNNSNEKKLNSFKKYSIFDFYKCHLFIIISNVCVHFK